MPPNNAGIPIRAPNGPLLELSGAETARQEEFKCIDVVYKAEWFHVASGSRRLVEIDSPSDLEIRAKAVKDSQSENVSKSVLEVITTIFGTDRATNLPVHSEEVRGQRELRSGIILPESTSNSDTDSCSDSDGGTGAAQSLRFPKRSREPRQRLASTSLDDVDIAGIGKTRLVLHSPKLLNAIRRAIDYYPGQDLTGKSVTIKEPYMCLVHHHDVLKRSALPCEVSQPGQACKLHSDPSICDVETKAHIQVLLDFLHPFMESSILPALEKLKRDVPIITYDMVWLLFQPGTDIYADFHKSSPSTGGLLMSSVVRDVKYNSTRKRARTGAIRTESLEIMSWFMCTNGEDIGRCNRKNTIRHFEGEKEVAQLPVYPSRYADVSLIAKFTERGRVATELLKSPNKDVLFDGSTYTERNRAVRKYQGKAIIDPQSSAKYQRPSDIIELTDENPTPMVIEDRSSHLIELGMKINKYSDYDSLTTNSTLTDHQRFLMYPFISGFGLDDKEWKFFHTEGIKNAQHDQKALGKLELEDSDKNVIKAISHRQAGGHMSKNIDFIEGKGQGQVILLHGPPGVGKTYTVEAIAAYFKRPLLSLSIADIGTKEELVDGELTRWLKLAETWNAVLLIDEADVFLQKRSRDNITHNGLVSVFLRKMEYFQGLLFLTTNRLGQMDDAFASRIHAKIHYPRLNHKKRSKIWEAFFDKLKEDSGKRMFVAKTAKEYVLQSPDIKARHWNGREIRNAFQTAITLAEYEASEDDGRPEGQAVEIKKEHFKQVMEMSKKFTEYVDRLDGRNENERARARTERDDYLSDNSDS